MRRLAKKRKKKHRDPMKLLMILCLELIVVLVLLILCAKVFPDNPITRSITSLIIEDPQVVLDAGHGGYDSGSNFGDIYEKNVTLALTKKIGTALENKGIKVAYTRTSDEVSWPADEVADLTRRVEISNTSHAKVFVSIHTNASELGSSVNGFEIWGKIKDTNVFELSKQVMGQMEQLQYTQNRGIKDQDLAPLQVLQDNQLPAILIETGFLENENDRAYLTNEASQQALADKIAQGIYNYIKQNEP
ncbi:MULTISPECIES: N-acetylmuramoyl-L-alanine amidase family protein [Erysipelotrichaceae]|uniref:N-acetylmuramoyl-L-alanine amidase n=1 Tax=Amedibacillus hominis TaxID=2897776 RepID=A0ABS9R5E2_9FIRM|nr:MULTISPECIES: N-acetylmuramoyl-L-alanine amidase [unclassified Absiella]MCH4284870.1 N-acetylmuramoyl-L-alanine amidase [Amedibacillus hominis]